MLLDTAYAGTEAIAEDVTSDAFTIDEYIDGVEYMLQRSISSASMLGALKSRIEMQAEFANILMDNIDRGIGRLVDAENGWSIHAAKGLANAAQLTLQSLQIANSQSQSTVQLFN